MEVELIRLKFKTDFESDLPITASLLTARVYFDPLAR